jgi:TPR repeat protein
MGRLGRAYRDGMGVPKDLEKSAQWFRRALDHGAKWVIDEMHLA